MCKTNLEEFMLKLMNFQKKIVTPAGKEKPEKESEKESEDDDK